MKGKNIKHLNLLRDSKIKELFVQITSEDMYFFFNFDLLIFLENLVS